MANGLKNEEYVVKFWVKNPETGFVEQHTESVYLFSKGKHEQAAKEIKNKYRGKGLKADIVSIIYQ